MYHKGQAGFPQLHPLPVEKEEGFIHSDYENRTFSRLNFTQKDIEEQDFQDCRFENCTLEGCKFIRCRFTDCTFVHCSIINPVFEDSSMMSCGFSGCRLVNVNWGQLVGGGYIIPLEALDNCQLKYNNFLEINFVKFDFSGNAILSSLFASCNLTESSFRQCQLEQTEFFQCDLTKADFRDASGYGIDLATNTLKKARFSFPEACRLLDSLGIILE